MMNYIITADTDIGTCKKINQDSILIKHAQTSKGDVLLAIVCDGMGGLSKGELASAHVIRSFSKWFDHELTQMITHFNMDLISHKWESMLRDLNVVIRMYGESCGMKLGTTFTGILMMDNQYVIGHVGDTRIYHIQEGIKQLTSDHSVIARELEQKKITVEQAKTDKRKNMLLQCIGASTSIVPQMLQGRLHKGCYMLCSDGLRHEASDYELYNSLLPSMLIDKVAMHKQARYLIDLVKARKERDNISIVVINVIG